MMEKRDVELGKRFPDRDFLKVIDSEIEYLRRTRIEDAEAIPKSQRRLIKSHNPLKLLPQDLLQRNKVRMDEAIIIFIYSVPSNSYVLGCLRSKGPKGCSNIILPSP